MISWTRKGSWMEVKIPHIPQEESVDYAELSRLLPMPEKLWKKWQQQKLIRKRSPRHILLPAFPDEEPGCEPEWVPLEVLYEDDFVLVVNKPAGMPVHPNEPGQRGTLMQAVAAYYESGGQRCRVRHIHRLDAETTGAVLYAKNEWIHLLLDEGMRLKTVRREYAALAEGCIEPTVGVLDMPIGRDRHHKSKRRVTLKGQHAVTRYVVAAQLEQAALLHLSLETGRTHQIRVHLSHIGHPLLGDSLYGGNTALISRQALHGERISFSHPITGEDLRIEAPWPEDFTALYAKLKAETKI
ncbi:RNA pseudouridine synthase [Paenibacillus larvae subsp. pulvifaciens]|uniref:RluA family pseudouridine synthase n=1 Tax=Paenibacillus larvae TaxID=1464 RepID=UPI0009C2F7BE|nr:RluA family pseudouridine synthase [Paenibacillus larvae]AQT84074.1 RNA pseudouridine synthase [Paenibacillus larvae subsp. pulvifaciens]MCY9773394.1 RluA family pseudouridine synthase [Paenibacillus larvae]